MSRRSLLVLALAACSERAAPASAPVAQAADAGRDAAAPAARVVVAPHSSEVAVIAVTDDARAAITADDRGELRFWPALDGTREPVVVRGQPPTELALARAPDGYVAAVLDAAHGIELLALARDGGVRGRRLLAAEPGYVELAATRDALLARRADQTIVRLDGARALAPAAGEQVLAIAARGDHALAAVADPERPTEIASVRAVALDTDAGTGLAWGVATALPEPLAPPIALSPSGRRIAGLHARTGAAMIIELGAKAHVLATESIADSDDHALGFLDDDRVVFRGGVVVRVPMATVVVDPWDPTRSAARVRLGRGAVIADHLGIAGVGTSLVLVDGRETRFLGYRDVGAGFLRITGARITLGLGSRVLWLDDRLRVRRSRDVASDALVGLAVSDTQLLKGTYSYLANDQSQLDLALLDAETGAEHVLGKYPRGATAFYDPETSVYAVTGHGREVARAHLDRATRTVTPLRALKARPDAGLELLDPASARGQASARGIVAIAYVPAADGAVLIETFVDDGKSNRPIPPAASVTVKDAVQVLGFDRAGAAYTLVARHTVVVYRGADLVKRIAVDPAVTGGAVDRAGTQLAMHSDTDVILYDGDGKERWRVPAWSVNIARFTADGKTLIVNTQGGLMALDTATGARQATGCGWNFGLSTTEPQLSIFITTNVCTEAP